MAELADRWKYTLLVSEIDAAIAESPDGQVHAGLSTDSLTLCERMNDTWLGGDRTYVRLNLDLPGADAERRFISCEACLEVIHS